eukprot:TRINITY_DN49379_c0_g1_i1.p1 TRINITY_DN49379_c0_g1~~TRINITY_DN49379_c0_g1_i1.p1  ORF type:complete len:216 (+),score=46.72 TRINITY_DN49379_c0_g1_i1:42-650(+)
MAELFVPGRTSSSSPRMGRNVQQRLPLLLASAAALLLLNALSNGREGGAFVSSGLSTGTNFPTRLTRPWGQFKRLESPSPIAENLEATVVAEEAAESSTALLCGGSLALLLAAGSIARDVSMGASPKKKRTKWRTRMFRVLWYERSNWRAKEALKLGRGIKNGTVDFIYGKPQDEEDVDDDFDDDEEYDDEDDEELEKQSIA